VCPIVIARGRHVTSPNVGGHIGGDHRCELRRRPRIIPSVFRHRAPLAIAALAVASALTMSVAAIAKPKPKEWTVSLTGTARTDDSYSKPGTDSAYVNSKPPDGCLDNTTTTYQLHASARMSSKPDPQPLSPGAGVPGIFFNLTLSSLTASASDQVTGSWAVDPNYSPPGSFSSHPVDPSVCAGFTPFTFSRPCAFKNGQTRSYTILIGLYLPNRHDPLTPPGRFFLYNSGETGGLDPGDIITCTQTSNALGSYIPAAVPESGNIPFLQEELSTNLRTSAVFGLRVGRSTSASGAIVYPISEGDPNKKDGNETISYTLKVKRVR
jgi:hypothetical protein